jgi:hypothetical protein
MGAFGITLYRILRTTSREETNRPKLKESQNMKQFIGLIRFGALTAASAVAHQKTLATKILDSQLPREGELVLLAIDGTVVAREINLVPRAGGYGSIPLERYRRVSNRPFARVFRSR